MKSLGIFEVKTRLSELVKEAAAGETIVITHKGRPVAQITRVESDGRERAREFFRRTDALSTRYQEKYGAISDDEIVALVHSGRKFVEE